VSECPLAGKHILQVMRERASADQRVPAESVHPIELLARSYGLDV